MPERFKIFSSIDAAEKVLPEGSPRKLILNGKPYCILRKGDGIFAMDDACPHNRASLSEGRINTFNEIICPLHEYRFDLCSGRESGLRCEDLQTYPVKIETEGVFMSL